MVGNHQQAVLWLQRKPIQMNNGILINYGCSLEYGFAIKLLMKRCFFSPATGPPTGVARQATSAIVAKYENSNET